ncbi:hypothetical protein PIB30_092583, partial [Stylosanthes scabra]|nr:hypothetical protein [Stylosanthes scabra]
ILCKSCPVQFASYFRYCHSLTFDQPPDYGFLKHIFRDLFTTQGYDDSNHCLFDWTILKFQQMQQKKTLIQSNPPIIAVPSSPEPKHVDNDQQAKPSVIIDHPRVSINSKKSNVQKFINLKVPTQKQIEKNGLCISSRMPRVSTQNVSKMKRSGGTSNQVCGPASNNHVTPRTFVPILRRTSSTKQ